LIQRYEDDLKRDDAWLYLGFQRRVRRLASGQITDAFLGSDAMIEDFEGYNGRISDYNWEYVATKNILLPYYNDRTQQTLDSHPENDPDGFQFVMMGGKGNCFPQVTWQLRKVYVINGTPKDENHPLSARVAYQDAQTGTLGMVYIYDKKGDPWKWFPICKVHSDAKGGLERNKGTGVAIDDCAVFFDEQAAHCTTLQFKSVINAEENPAKIFSVQNMRKKGKYSLLGSAWFLTGLAPFFCLPLSWLFTSPIGKTTRRTGSTAQTQKAFAVEPVLFASAPPVNAITPIHQL
jgi:hypothetical protein